MELVIIETPTRQQLAAEHFILSICIANHLGPEDLDRLAHRLAAVDAIADAHTFGINHAQNTSRIKGTHFKQMYSY